jgi:hypothetical protein
MSSCLCCGAGAEIGVLCRACAHEVAPCDGLIADHVRSTVEPTEAVAWVVDGFGAPHGLAAKTGIGRSQDGELVILSASVSREHAELREADGHWHARDLGSRNGTFVDGARVTGRVPLAMRAKLKIGDVALWFLGEVSHEPVSAPSLVTGSAAGSLVRFTLAPEQGELCLVGGSDAGTGGALLHRASSTASWAERSLPPLEFQLLKALCSRAVEEAGSPAAVRGCVATKQLARDLPWQSKYANEENVRQVVRRLREGLGELGAAAILAVAPGRGYYLACPVTIAGAR